MAIFSDIDPNVTSGTQLANILNSFKDSIASGFIDTSLPTNMVAGGRWIDSTSDPVWIYKVYNGTTSVDLLTFNKTTGAVSLSGVQDSFEIQKESDDSLPAILTMAKERVTGSTQVEDGDTIAQMNFEGNDDTDTRRLSSQIEVVAENDFTSTQHGSFVSIKTTAEDSNTLTERVRINKFGRIGFGGLVDSDLAVASQATGAGAGIHLRQLDDTVDPATVRIDKQRVSGNGQVLNADFVGRHDFMSTDETGAKHVVARVETKALENHSSTQRGTSFTISTVNTGESTLTEIFKYENGVLTLAGQVGGDTKETLALAHGGVAQDLLELDSTTTKAAIIELFAEGQDGTEERIQFSTIKATYDSFNSTWVYEESNDIMFGPGQLFTFAYTNAATLDIDYNNQLNNGTFVSGTIKLSVRRFLV